MSKREERARRRAKQRQTAREDTMTTERHHNEGKIPSDGYEHATVVVEFTAIANLGVPDPLNLDIPRNSPEVMAGNIAIAVHSFLKASRFGTAMPAHAHVSANSFGRGTIWAHANDSGRLGAFTWAVSPPTSPAPATVTK
jgi:hypothetical protein